MRSSRSLTNFLLLNESASSSRDKLLAIEVIDFWLPEESFLSEVIVDFVPLSPLFLI